LPIEGTDEVYILCRSTARQEKERAMHERFRIRIKEGLHRLHAQCENGRAKKINTVERRIGRLLGSNSRAASMFDISVEMDGARVRLEWKMKKEVTEWAQLSEGCYLLRAISKSGRASSCGKPISN
jgi:hypothetical protein